jgi:hypothetical protein
VEADTEKRAAGAAGEAGMGHGNRWKLRPGRAF